MHFILLHVDGEWRSCFVLIALLDCPPEIERDYQGGTVFPQRHNHGVFVDFELWLGPCLVHVESSPATRMCGNHGLV